MWEVVLETTLDFYEFLLDYIWNLIRGFFRMSGQRRVWGMTSLKVCLIVVVLIFGVDASPDHLLLDDKQVPDEVKHLLFRVIVGVESHLKV